MKFTVGIIIGVIAGFLIITVLVVFLVLSNFRSVSSTATPIASATAIPVPGTTSTIPSSLIPTSANPAATAPPASSTANVNFSLNIIGISGSGLTRTVSGEIWNTGTSDAHNAWVKIEVSTGGKKIQINGQDFIRKDLGTIKARTSITDQINLTFSLMDAPTLLSNGATVTMTIYSDEKTQSMTYDYKP